jgi:TP901 family phage tail tape measure protein
MAVENIIFRITTEVTDKEGPVVLAASIEKLDKEYTDAQKKVTAFNNEVNKGATGANASAQAANNAAKGAQTLGNTVQGAANGMRGLGAATQGAGQAVNNTGASARKAAQDMGNLGKASKETGGIIAESVKQFAQFFAIDAIVRGVFNTISGGVDSIIEFDDALAELSSITGATGTDLDFLREASIRFSQETTVGASDVAKAFTAIGSARPDLLKNKEALSEVTREAITLSEAAKIDLATAGAAVAGALNQFNLPASESGRIINVLAAGSLEGAANISEVGETIDKVGTVLAANNVTIEQGVALTETLAEKNLKGAEAGTQLRNIVLRLVQSGKGFVDGQFNINAALEQTRKEFEGIQDPVKRAEAQVKLFGLESVTAANILLNNTSTFERLTTAVTGTDVAYRQAETNNATLAASLAKLGNAVENVFLGFTQTSSVAGRAINFLAENLESIVKVVGSGIIAFTAYRAIVASLLVLKKAYQATVAAVTVVKRLYTIATTNAAGATRALNIATNATPWGLLIGGIAAVVSALVLFNDETEKANKNQKDLNDKTKEAIALRLRLATAGADVNSQVNARAALDTEQLQALSANIDQQIAEYDRLAVEVAGKETASAGAIEKAREERNQKILELEKELATEQDQLRRFDIQLQIDNLKDAASDRREVTRIAGVAITLDEATQNKKRLEGQKKLVEDTLKERKKLEGKGTGTTSDKAAETPALAGSIKALQDEQKKLQNILTDKVKIGSEEFNKVRDQYIDVTKRLKEAQDLLGEKEVFPAGSLNALNAELRTLKTALDNLPGDATNFDEVSAKVKVLQAEIDKLNKKIAGADEADPKARLNRLQEEERTTLAFADLDQQAKVTLAQNAKASQDELDKIERDGNRERLVLQLDFARRKLEILQASGIATEDDITEQTNRVRELEATLNLPASKPKSDADIRREYVAGVAEDAQKIAQLGIDAWKAWSDAQQQSLDLQIQAQEGRVQEARELADKGNATVLEQEKKRLQQLNDERKRAARQSLAIAQLEAAAAGAVAIARAAAEGGGFLTAVTIASTIIALTAGLAQARALTTSSIPAFRKGGSADWSRLGGYTGSGNPDNISNVLGGKPYIYHANEYIMPHEVVSVGDNKRWLEQIHRGRVDIGKMLGKNKGVKIGIDGDRGADRIVKAIESQPRTSVYMDGEGISMLVQGHIRKTNMLNTRR